jgi:hypothetical protein
MRTKIIFFLLMLPALVGCGPLLNLFMIADSSSSQVEPVVSDSRVIGDFASLMDALNAHDVTVGENISQPFIPVEGQIVMINGEGVQVFEFADEAAASETAATIPPDGASFATVMVTWIATPHFYHSGRLIVLYVGDNAAITALLESLLGPQIAGGR